MIPTTRRSYNTGEVAEMYGMSRQWVRDQVSAGRLQTMRSCEAKNAPMLFGADDLDRFEESMRERNSDGDPPRPARSRRRRKRRAA